MRFPGTIFWNLKILLNAGTVLWNLSTRACTVLAYMRIQRQRARTGFKRKGGCLLGYNIIVALNQR